VRCRMHESPAPDTHVLMTIWHVPGESRTTPHAIRDAGCRVRGGKSTLFLRKLALHDGSFRASRERR
jgi:hypothetical protein